MATISHNDLAPSGVEVSYSLGSADPFTLTGDATYEVAPPAEDAEDYHALRVQYDSLIGNAQAHPWLKVEIPVEADAAAADQALAAVEFPHTAIDASLDQDSEEYASDDAAQPIAETLAADDAQGDEPVEVDDPATAEPVDPAKE